MENLLSMFTFVVPAQLWQLLLLVLIVINIKNLPLVWHVRIIDCST